jgi:uncharacterized protein (TIGR02271 family)
MSRADLSRPGGPTVAGRLPEDGIGGPSSATDASFSGGLSAADASFNGGLSAADQAILDDGGSIAVPVVAEEVTVSRREVETGRVRVRVAPVTEDRIAHVDVGRTEVEVERVPVGREVAEYPQERLDGDTRVIPIVEERLVVTKVFYVVEEIRVRRRRVSERRDIPVTLTRDAVSIERLPADGRPNPIEE